MPFYFMMTKPPHGHPPIKNCVNFANFYLEFTTSKQYQEPDLSTFVKYETQYGSPLERDIKKHTVDIPEDLFDGWDLEAAMMSFKFDDYDRDFAKMLDGDTHVRSRHREDRAIYGMIPFRYQQWMEGNVEGKWFYRIKKTDYLYQYGSEFGLIWCTFVFEKSSDAVMFKMRFSDE